MREGKSRAGRFMAVLLAAVVFVLSGSVWTAGDMTTFAAGVGTDFGRGTDFARVFDLAGLFSGETA